VDTAAERASFTRPTGVTTVIWDLSEGWPRLSGRPGSRRPRRPGTRTHRQP